MFQTIWEYDVFSEHVLNFKQAYCSDGDWVKLFQKADGFIETVLIEDINNKTKFITIDKWNSSESYNTFKANFKSEYTKMDTVFESFTKSENHIGSFKLA